MRLIDDLLNQITTYRLVLYYLIFLVLIAGFLSFFGLLPFKPLALLVSVLLLVLVCYFSNRLLALIFHAPVNIESSYITALILALIITPAESLFDFIFLFAAAAIAMAGKYIFFWNRKHIFNPAAAAVVTTSLTIGGYPSWWVGTALMVPFLALGILVVRKIKRFEEVFSFFGASILTSFFVTLSHGNDPLLVLKNSFLYSPILFFACIMLVEPQSSPTRRNLQILYGLIVGVLFSSQLKLAGFYITPEVALLAGNLFAYLFGMKSRLALKLKQKKNMDSNILDFTFTKPQNFHFSPGQYLEWTLAQKKADSRGNRRYFTIASSPTEDTLRIGVRFDTNGSSFKRGLSSLSKNGEIVAGQLGGDFVLPKDVGRKLVFIAGGIGVTPYRSIIKYLTDKNEKRDIVLFYINKREDDIVYKNIFDDAEKKLGLRTIYILTDKEAVPKNWKGRRGRIDQDIIKQEIPDFSVRTFYLSGPHAMVESYKKVLAEMKIPSSQIATDYFPGYS